MRAAALLVPWLLCGVARADVDVDINLGDTGDRALDEVVVLAARRPQPLREAPASSSIINAEDLEAYGWRNFTEAIASLAGFYTSDARDNTNLGVRGVSQKGDTNSRILILVDGHQQQELWSHSAYPEQIGLDAGLIDHIEVLRGPASALYGSLGFLAIVNIVTRRGQPGSWARATFEMEDLRGFRGVLHVGHRFGNGLEVALNLQAVRDLGASYKYPDLERDNGPCATPGFPGSCGARSLAANDAATGVSLFAHAEWKRFTVNGSFQYYDKQIPFGPYRSIFNEANHFLTQRAYVELGYDIGRPSVVAAHVRAHYDYAGYLDDLVNSSDGTRAGRTVFHDDANPFWTGAEAQLLLERQWGPVQLDATGGGTFTFLRGDDRSGQIGMPMLYLQHDQLFGSVYAQVEAAYHRKLFLTVGVRGDFSDTYPSEPSPRVGLVLLPYRHGTFKLLYSHGFIHPSWYATFFNDGVSISDNPHLKPERADNYELVYQHELSDTMIFTGSVFYIHGSELIGQTTVCVPATAQAPATPDCPPDRSVRTQSDNINSFQSIGTELGVTGKLQSGLRLYANYSFAHAQNGDGSRPFNSPEHMLKLGFAVPLWREHLWIGGEARYFSSRRLGQIATDESDPVLLFNGHLTWKNLPRGFTATLKVYNLGATTYYEPSQAEDSFPITRIPHTGPTALLRLSYAY